MSEIRNLTRNGETFYPLTIAEAVSDPNAIIGKYIENPEWIRVITDSEGKVLAGIKANGEIEWSLGVPTPVKEYIQGILSNYSTTSEIQEALSNIQTALSGKVDKIEGKSLSTNDYTDTDKEIVNVSSLTNDSEFLEVTTDNEGKILEGIQKDGTKVISGSTTIGGNTQIEGNTTISGDVTILGKVDIQGATYILMQSPEWIRVVVDAQNHILCGIKADGNIYLNSLTEVPSIIRNAIQGAINTINVEIASLDERISALESVFFLIDNPEYIDVETDNEGKVLSGRNIDGSKFENLPMEFKDKVSIDGNVIENIQDIEGRTEIKADSEDKIISYRDKEGVLHEEVGIKSKEVVTDILNAQNLQMPYDSLAGFKESLNSIEEPYKRPNIPLYGTSNIKSETFYLNADERYSDKNGVYLIQDYPDTVENATNKVTLSYFYIKSTLQDNGDGTYSKYDDGVEGHDVKLTFYAAAKVTKVDDTYYVTSTLDENGQPTAESIEVTQITDVPPYKAWPVDKKTEHYCLVDINFGDYLTQENIKVGVKYQGSSTLANRKRNFRFTFYKSSAKPYYPFDGDKFGKKDKVKFGDMLRLSGYNLKANWSDRSRIKELILYPTLLSVWQQRPEYNRFPWDNEFSKFTAATGFIQGFPIKLYIDGSFYGMMVFGLKKDERNYVLDGDDDSSGIFVSGSSTSSICWQRPMGWEDEMMDEMSQETTDAISEWFDFINNRLVDENQNPIPFNIKNIPSRLDVQGFIDYFICLQVFIMWDNTQRNMVLHTRSDKKKFYPFFYDLDLSLQYPYDSDVFEISTRIPDGHGGTYSRDMAFWQTIVDTFWDDIVNRYHNLRASVLKVEYINQIYHAYADSIPDSDYTEENARWGVNTSKSNFNSVLTLLKNRLDWLDSNYFIN